MVSDGGRWFTVETLKGKIWEEKKKLIPDHEAAAENIKIIVGSRSQQTPPSFTLHSITSQHHHLSVSPQLASSAEEITTGPQTQSVWVFSKRVVASFSPTAHPLGVCSPRFSVLSHNNVMRKAVFLTATSCFSDSRICFSQCPPTSRFWFTWN